MKILVTGFDLWGSVSVNPSWEMIKNLPTNVGNHTIIIAKVPVVYASIKSTIVNLINQHNPDVIVSFGLAESIQSPRIESYGWNYGAGGKDANGIAKNGPLESSLSAKIGYATTYNYNDHVGFWVSSTSYSTSFGSVDAGDFLCNALIYFTGQHLASVGRSTPFMFSHVPSMTGIVTQEYLEGYAKLLITKVVQANRGSIDFAATTTTGSSNITSNLLTNVSGNDYTTSSQNITYRASSPGTNYGEYRFEATIETNQEHELKIINLGTKSNDTQIFNLTPGTNKVSVSWVISSSNVNEYNNGITLQRSFATSMTIKGGTAKYGKVG